MPPNRLPERNHRCPLFRRVSGPKNQSYYINFLFLLGCLLDDSSRAINFRVSETNNSVTNIMNQIYRINLVNSAIQDCVYYMAYWESKSRLPANHNRQISIKLIFIALFIVWPTDFRHFVQWTRHIYNILQCMACITETTVLPSHFSWFRKRMERPTRGKRYNKWSRIHGRLCDTHYDGQKIFCWNMGKNYILFFDRKHALNTPIYSVLRNLWSGISCYSCNWCNFFISSHFLYVVFSALCLSVTTTESR